MGDLWFCVENTEDACIPVSVRRPASIRHWSSPLGSLLGWLSPSDSEVLAVVWNYFSVCAAVIIMRSWQFLFDSCDFGQALGLCENAYRSWCFINMNGNDNLDQGYRMYTVPLALPQSCCMGQETDQVSLFSTLAVLILPWWNKTASQKFLVVFEAGGCEDLVMGVFKLSYLCEMGQCCFIPTFTEGEVRPSDATHQRLHKACGTESRFWPSFL